MEDNFKEIEDFTNKRKSVAAELEASKYNLDDLLDKFRILTIEFYEKGESEEEKSKFPVKNAKVIYEGAAHTKALSLNVYSDLITLLDLMTPSILGPFHHYNNYMDNYIKDFLKDDLRYSMGESERRDSGMLTKTKYQMEIQALLMAVKAGLDRFVGVFSYYYKGISPHTTFGRYKEKKNKFEGFMNTVDANKDDDELMKFIHENYFDWIATAVAPRDTITHYNDLPVYYEFDSETGGEIPVHYSKRMIKAKGVEEPPIYVFNHETLRMYTLNWYKFVEFTLAELVKKYPITYYPKF